MSLFDKAFSAGKAILKADRALVSKADGLLEGVISKAPLGEQFLEARNSVRQFVGDKLKQGVDHVREHGREYIDDPSKLRDAVENHPLTDKVKNVAHKAWDFIPDGVKTAAAGAVAGPVGVAAVETVDLAEGAVSPSSAGVKPAGVAGPTV